MSKFKVITDFPIAFDSPDHLAPHGTKRDNSSDELWINNIVDLFGRKRKMRISSAIEMCLYQQPPLQYKSSVDTLTLRKKLQKRESF